MKKLWLPLMLSVSSVLYVAAVPKDLVKKLDADEFATRSQAQKDLLKWAKSAEKDELKELKKIYEQEGSPEVKMRLYDVLDITSYVAKPNTRGFVGITMGEVFGGVRVDRVEPKTPAEIIGLKLGDIIVGVDKNDLSVKKKNISEATQFFSSYVKSKNAGEKLDLKVLRNGKMLEKSLKLGDFDKFNHNILRQRNQLVLPNNRNKLLLRQGAQLQIQPRKLRVPAPKVMPDPQVEKLKAEARKALEEALRNQQELLKLRKEHAETLKELKKKLNK